MARVTIFARIPEEQPLDLMRGYGDRPYLVSGRFEDEDRLLVHERLAETLDEILNEIARIKWSAVDGTLSGNPLWPMIITCTSKGWTCPKEIDGLPIERTWRAHQVPLAKARDAETHTRILENWVLGYGFRFGWLPAVRNGVRGVSVMRIFEPAGSFLLWIAC